MQDSKKDVSQSPCVQVHVFLRKEQDEKSFGVFFPVKKATVILWNSKPLIRWSGVKRVFNGADDTRKLWLLSSTNINQKNWIKDDGEMMDAY